MSATAQTRDTTGSSRRDPYGRSDGQGWSPDVELPRSCRGCRRRVQIAACRPYDAEAARRDRIATLTCCRPRQLDPLSHARRQHVMVVCWLYWAKRSDGAACVTGEGKSKAERRQTSEAAGEAAWAIQQTAMSEVLPLPIVLHGILYAAPDPNLARVACCACAAWGRM